MGLLAAAGGVLAVPESRAQQAAMHQLLSGWPGEAPSALSATGSGPFWTRRARDIVLLEALASGRVRELARAQAPGGHPPRSFRPQLMRGPAAPELFYRKNARLVAQNGGRLAGALGNAGWESYSAARSGPSLLAAAFGIRRDGISRIAFIHNSDAPVVVTKLREPSVGVWAPVSLLSSSRAYVLYRAFLVSPGRGHGIISESMAISALRSQRRWNPVRRQWAPEQQGYYYGDPSACLDEAGQPHFAATIWNPRDQPTGRVAVDGIELAQAGRASYWLPQLASVPGRGRILAMIGPAGAVQIGSVQGNQFALIAELPGKDPLLAAHGRSIYVSTSAGLWTYAFPASRVAIAAEVPAAAPAALLAAALLIAAFGARGLRRCVPAN